MKLSIFLICFLIGIIATAEQEANSLFKRVAVNDVGQQDTQLVDIERYVGNIIGPTQKGQKSHFVVHVSSFKDEFEAIKMVKELQKSESNVYYRPLKLSGQKWYRVYAGRFNNAGDAESFLITFKGKTSLPNLVIAEVKEDESYKIVSEKVRGIASVEKKKSYYSIQVGSFPQRVLAEDRSQAFLKKSIDVEVVEAEIKGQKWYRLYIGRFNTAREAKALKAKLSLEIPKDSLIKKRTPK